MNPRLLLALLVSPALALPVLASGLASTNRVALSVATLSGWLVVFVLLHRFGLLGRRSNRALRELPRPRFLKAMAPLLAVLVLSSGHILFTALRYDELEPAWSLPKSEATKRLWDAGDAFVQVRSDAVSAYGAADGRARWSHGFPHPEKVCSASRHTQDGIGLVTYASGGGPCDRVAAFDLGTGRSLWTYDFPENRKYPLRYRAGAELGPGGAVVYSEHGVTVLDPRTGAPGRSPRIPSGCFPLGGEQTAAIGGGRVAVLLSCQNDESLLLSVSELSTDSSWSATLGAKAQNARLLSTDPLVAEVRRLGPETPDETSVFDPADGKRLASIRMKGSYLGPPALVGSDLIYAVASEADDLAAYSFTGEVRWSTRFEDGIALMHDTGSGPVVVSGLLGEAFSVTVLDPRSGAETREARLPGSFSPSGLSDILLASDRLLLVEEDGEGKSSKAHAFGFRGD